MSPTVTQVCCPFSLQRFFACAHRAMNSSASISRALCPGAAGSCPCAVTCSRSVLSPLFLMLTHFTRKPLQPQSCADHTDSFQQIAAESAGGASVCGAQESRETAQAFGVHYGGKQGEPRPAAHPSLLQQSQGVPHLCIDIRQDPVQQWFAKLQRCYGTHKAHERKVEQLEAPSENAADSAHSYHTPSSLRGSSSRAGH